jgi:HK97 family phage portal protein
MSLWDNVRQFLALEPMQERTIVDPFTAAPDLAAQIAALHAAQAQARPWRLPSISETLGVPAILRAVTLISNTVGSLSIQGIRDEMPMDEAPRVITRPDPFRTPQEVYRDMAWAMATRGETVLWIAARDSNTVPLSLIVVPLAELTVEENMRNRLYPIYKWGTVASTRYSAANPSGDFVHITFAKQGPLDLRGVGPLQLCGAAASVAVEAQEWAANFFAGGGGIGSVELHSEVDISDAEAAVLKAQWIATPSNMPKVTNPSLTLKEFGVNEQGAQMMQARDYQNGDAARMFGIPGSLLDYSSPGSSLTYQNLEGEFGKFVRGCLAINYLAPIEQALSDLLPRAIVARFYVDGLLRADIKTRYEVYASGITSGVLTVDEARTKEGLAPGNVEVARVPPAMPQAVPSSLPMQERSAEVPMQQRSAEVQCTGMRLRSMSAGQSKRLVVCGKLLALEGPFIGTCPRCRKVYGITAPAA